MGLPVQIIDLLLRDHKKRPFAGPLLTLGRQEVMCSYEQLIGAFGKAGIEPAPLPKGTPLGAFPGVGLAWQTNDVALFGHLNLETRRLDCSSFEGADYLHDLNLPIPDKLKGMFATVLDSGTIEHVFDVRRALMNTAEMLAPGGRVIHLSPVNNYVNHGFWQLSPTMFFDYYEANGFTDLSCELLIHPRDEAHAGNWAIFRYDPIEHFGINNFFSATDNMLAVLFTATKTEHATSDRIPVQAWYRKAHAGTRFLHYQYMFETTAEGYEVHAKAMGPSAPEVLGSAKFALPAET